MDDHELYGLFQQFRPHGQGVERVFDAVPNATEYVSRLLPVYSATSDADCENDFYFVVRKPLPSSVAEMQAIGMEFVGELRALATIIRSADLSSYMRRALQRTLGSDVVSIEEALHGLSREIDQAELAEYLARKAAPGATMLQVRRKPLPPPRLPRLQAGDHLDQPTFHARYKQMPESFRAELVEGVVFVLPPIWPDHGEPQLFISGWLLFYLARTPGTRGLDNTTVLLGPESEPQPDLALFVDPAYGGEMRRTEDGYWEGAPELVVEVANTSEAFDLHEKLRDYERAGVKEYLVVLVREKEVRWFERRGRRFQVLHKGRKGVFESRAFPGLRLDVAALFALDAAKVLDELQKGLDSPRHADFVAALRKRRGD